MKLLTLLLTLLAPLAAEERRIAITIDDLPCAGGSPSLERASAVTRRILAALRAEGATAIGFVNESRVRVPGQQAQRVALLQQWLDAGMMLGNHTFSHLDFNETPLEEFEQDVIRGEATFRPLLQARGRTKLFFRFPYTHTGGAAEKKTAFEAFLKSRGYTNAPFTVEHEDFLYNAAYEKAAQRRDEQTMSRIRAAYLERLDAVLPFVERVSRDLFGREIPQILLIHANTINAECLPAMLERLKARGYRGAPLERTLRDPAFATPDLYTGRFGPSWFHRWGIALGKKSAMQGEPETPAWVAEVVSGSKR